MFIKTQNAKETQDWEKVEYSYICVMNSLLIALGILSFKNPSQSLFFSHLGSIIWSIFLTWAEVFASVFSLDLKNLILKMRAIGTTWVLPGTADKSRTHSRHMKSMSLNFNKILSWFVYTLKFEKHCDIMPRRTQQKIMGYMLFREKFCSFYSFHWVYFPRFVCLIDWLI